MLQISLKREGADCKSLGQEDKRLLSANDRHGCHGSAAQVIEVHALHGALGGGLAGHLGSSSSLPSSSFLFLLLRCGFARGTWYRFRSLILIEEPKQPEERFGVFSCRSGRSPESHRTPSRILITQAHEGLPRPSKFSEGGVRKDTASYQHLKCAEPSCELSGRSSSAKLGG